MLADQSTVLVDRQQRRARDAKWHYRLVMVMANCVDVRSQTVNLAMDIAFRVGMSSRCVDWFANKVMLHYVSALDQLGRLRSGKKEAVCPLRVPDTHMPECIHHTFSCQDLVCENQFVHMVPDRRFHRKMAPCLLYG
jgi:hypothetical protein